MKEEQWLKKIKERLDDYSEEIPSDGWQRLEKALGEVGATPFRQEEKRAKVIPLRRWLAVAASYNAGQGRISRQLQRQMVDQAVDLWLVEETSRYMFRLLAAKAVFSDPQRYGFMLKREQLYPPIDCTTVTVTTGIDDLARFAKSKGITYAQLKDFNPWLRSTSLMNKSGRTYVLKIPTQAGMHYNPRKTVPHNPKWIVD